MSRPAGPVRQALLDRIAEGCTGTYEALAAIAGVEPERARAALKEIRRAGQAGRHGCQRQAGRPGAARGIFGARSSDTVDALGFAHQVWR